MPNRLGYSILASGAFLQVVVSIALGSLTRFGRKLKSCRLGADLDQRDAVASLDTMGRTWPSKTRLLTYSLCIGSRNKDAQKLLESSIDVAQTNQGQSVSLHLATYLILSEEGTRISACMMVNCFDSASKCLLSVNRVPTV